MRSIRRIHLVILCLLICIGCVMEKGKVPNPVHDVAITNVLIPSDCNQGDIVPIMVRLSNQGTRRETFRVILSEGTFGK